MKKNKFPILFQNAKTSLFKIPCSVFIIIKRNHTKENKNLPNQSFTHSPLDQ